MLTICDNFTNDFRKAVILGGSSKYLGVVTGVTTHLPSGKRLQKTMENHHV